MKSNSYYDPDSLMDIRPSLRATRENKMVIPSSPKIKIGSLHSFKQSAAAVDDPIHMTIQKPIVHPKVDEVTYEESSSEVNSTASSSDFSTPEIELSNEQEALNLSVVTPEVTPSQFVNTHPEDGNTTDSSKKQVVDIVDEIDTVQLEGSDFKAAKTSIFSKTRFVYGASGAMVTMTLVGFGYYLGFNYTTPFSTDNNPAVLSESISRDIVNNANVNLVQEGVDTSLVNTNATLASDPNHPSRFQISSINVNSQVVVVPEAESTGLAFPSKNSVVNWVSTTANLSEKTKSVYTMYFGSDDATIKDINSLKLDQELTITSNSGDLFHYKISKIEIVAKDLIKTNKVDYNRADGRVVLMVLPVESVGDSLGYVIYAK